MKKCCFKKMALVALSAMLVSCNGLLDSDSKLNLDETQNVEFVSNETESSRAAKSVTYTKLAGDNGAITYNSQYNMYTITGSKVTNGWNFATIDLSQFAGQTVEIDLHVGMHLKNNGWSTKTLRWQVNTDSYPTIVEKSYGHGESQWEDVHGKLTVKLDKSSVIYLSTYDLTPSDFLINVYNVNVKVTAVSGGNTGNTGNGGNTGNAGNGGSTGGSSSNDYVTDAKVDWMKVPALKNEFSKYFDYFGFACEYGANGGNEFSKTNVQKGLAYHGNTITMGNEFKPDFLFNWQQPNQNGTFTSSKGVTIKVPTNTPNFSNIDRILTICKNNGLKMRGHVLVWHSQTQEWFFHQNYNANAGYVSAREMDARQEWYIKTVLEHVTQWEKQNNGGKHIIWAWDVVNEAVADDASGNNWPRGSTGGSSNSSSWYKVYKNYDFIVNAFRYANKYAPKDVLLCYNDYNEYMGNKVDGIEKLLKAVIAARNDSNLPTRIDVMGMQSHVGLTFPTINDYQRALDRYFALGLDVHVTEFDIANAKSAYNVYNQRKLYKDYFNMFVKNSKKTKGGHGITCVTIWGINDENSWLQQMNGGNQHPLLFTLSNGNYLTKPEFYAVLEAARRK